jgi:hypothetical protein
LTPNFQEFSATAFHSSWREDKNFNSWLYLWTYEQTKQDFSPGRGDWFRMKGRCLMFLGKMGLPKKLDQETLECCPAESKEKGVGH